MVAEQNSAAQAPAPEGRIRFHNKALQAGFTQIPRSILHVPGLSRGAKLTWIALAEYAWSEEPVFPGQAVLAATLEVGLRTVVGDLQELRKAGLLQSHRRGLGLTNEYTLLCPEDVPAETPTPRRRTTGQIRNIVPIRHAARCATDVHPTTHPDTHPGAHPIKEETDSEETYSLDSTPHGVGADAPPPTQKQRRATSKETQAPTDTTGADLLIDELREALGCATIGEKTRAKWAAAFRATLAGCTPAERSRFVRWLVSSGYWSKETLFKRSGQLEAEAEMWLMAGKPERKPAAQSNGHAAAPPTDSDGRPRWAPEDTSVVDHEASKARQHFIAHFGKHPEFMTPAQRVAAGVADYVPRYPQGVPS